MTSTLAAFALRLADFYLVATVFLLATATVMVALRQPARRLAAASAGLAGLVLLAALAVLPFWPRLPVGRLFANPVYWWLRRAIRQDQELLADAAGVAGSGLSAADYAEVLVGWVRRSTSRASLAAAALGIWERPSQLTRRIAMLLDERFHVEAGTTRRWRYGVLIAAGLAAVGLSVLTLTAERPAVAAGEPEPSSQPAPTALARLRSPAQRVAQLKKEGGNEATEKAVAAALEWIVRHQSPDGSWGLGDYRKQCQDPACTDGDRVNQADPKAAATAMGLLPLLAAGHSHQAPGPYQTAVKKGLQWLVQNQKPDGDLSAGTQRGPWMYCHGLAALALCDAYAMTGDKELAGAAQRAVVFIEAAQDPQGGGWRYQPRQGGDTSVFGWQVAALRAAQLGRLKVQPATLEGARKYLRSAAVGERGSRFCYTPGGGATPSMTAVGLIGTQLLVHDGDPAALRDGHEFLLQTLPAARSNVYLLHYATQALHQASGKEWQTWNEAVRDFLVKAQQPGPGCAAGSWDPATDTWGKSSGRLMITSFACLCLEVYYRYPRLASGLVANPPAVERSPQARASRGTGSGRVAISDETPVIAVSD